MFLTCLKIFSFPNIQYITSHSQLQVTWAEAGILKYSTSSSVYCNIFQKVNNDNKSFQKKIPAPYLGEKMIKIILQDFSTGY